MNEYTKTVLWIEIQRLETLSGVKDPKIKEIQDVIEMLNSAKGYLTSSNKVVYFDPDASK